VAASAAVLVGGCEAFSYADQVHQASSLVVSHQYMSAFFVSAPCDVFSCAQAYNNATVHVADTSNSSIYAVGGAPFDCVLQILTAPWRR
jgi:hypothetical protein